MTRTSGLLAAWLAALVVAPAAPAAVEKASANPTEAAKPGVLWMNFGRLNDPSNESSGGT